MELLIFLGPLALAIFFLTRRSPEARESDQIQEEVISYLDRLRERTDGRGSINAEEAQGLHAEIDRGTSIFLPICSAGCSHCCYQAVDIYPWEAKRIGEAFSALPPETQADIKSRADSWTRHYNSEYEKVYAERKEQYERTPFKIYRSFYGQTLDQFQRRDRIACPFLQDGFCSIYEARPAMCRLYFQFTDPFECEADPLRSPPFESKKLMSASFTLLDRRADLEPLIHGVHDELGLEVTMLGQGDDDPKYSFDEQKF
ncbi:MAG: YkgJ family cysteine cluster protein [Cohaesibacter sp.]|jgi:Fe-S-cluster containining protein|nr:YkgJ family cysteine cluster protein [Cohaesibacter sp.]